MGKEVLVNYVNDIRAILNELDYEAIYAVVDLFIECRNEENAIYFVGNGGSAATASHFAQDMGEVGRKTTQKGFNTSCLCDEAPRMTAIANDHGYENIFSLQLDEIFREKDILVAISASGNSPNIVSAAEKAHDLNGTVVGMTGFDGGKLMNLCDYSIHIPASVGEYGLVEDAHLVVNHMIFTCLLSELKND